MAANAHRLHGAFGQDAFGRFAEKTARFFGTPQHIVGQAIVVGAWIVLNGRARATPRRDPDRRAAQHRRIKAETDRLLQLVQSNTRLTLQDKELTEQVAALTREIHALVSAQGA